jgi:rare lipoprotein A
MLRLFLFPLLLVGVLPATASPILPVRTGSASYYSPKFHGRCCTANGEKVNVYSMTAAHRTLPMGAYVRVTNVRNQRAVIVRINDRGPYHGSRIIDLSTAAFKQIASPKHGVIKVRLDVVSLPKK